MPKKNHAGKGTGSWAKTVGFWKGYPGRFYKIFKTRTAVEAAFSAVKGQFAWRSVTHHMQERQLGMVSICRNMGV